MLLIKKLCKNQNSFLTRKDYTVIDVELQFTIKDWFGVDEEDVYKSAAAMHIAREALAAFWILQHQRGYRPFMNVIEYKERVTAYI